jgi:hypothetical protein
MIYSKPLLGTNTNKTTMSWWDYYISHIIPSAFQSFRHNFITWYDLVLCPDNHKNYSLLKDDDPFECCYNEFWYSINDDDTLPKFFLEQLMQMAEDVRTGKVETIPFTKDMFDDLKDLVGDMIEDTDITGTLDPADD